MSKTDERDVREEIKIAIFWRNLIGDFEYIKFDPDDMMRWFDALELRGPIEIRQLLRERYATRPVNAMLGITTRAPHPPTWLVREWLAFYEQKVSTKPAWLAAFGFMILSFMAIPLLHQCADLQPVSMYVMNPPSSGPNHHAEQSGDDQHSSRQHGAACHRATWPDGPPKRRHCGGCDRCHPDRRRDRGREWRHFRRQHFARCRGGQRRSLSA